MTGPEHYREAERLIDGAVTLESPFPHLRASELLAAAQVHATLALAAATAMAAYGGGDMPPSDREAWDQAAGVPEL